MHDVRTKICSHVCNIMMVYPRLYLRYVKPSSQVYLCIYSLYTYIHMCGIYLQICKSLPGQKIYASLHLGAQLRNFMTYNPHHLQLPFKWLGLNYTHSVSVNIYRSTEGYRASRIKEARSQTQENLMCHYHTQNKQNNILYSF